MQRIGCLYFLYSESEDFFVISAEDVLTSHKLIEFKNNISPAIDRSRRNKVLVLAENFSGWSKEGDWENLEFLLEHDPYIQKIAVVSGDKCKVWLLTFLGAGMRMASVKSFMVGEEQNARNWLMQKAE